jgi:hypothetical protein
VYFADNSDLLYIRDSVIETSLSLPSTKFCCNGSTYSVTNPTLVCSMFVNIYLFSYYLFSFSGYPVCNSSKCKEAKGCECPFTYIHPFAPIAPSPTPTLYPSVPTYNATCTCQGDSYGLTCDGMHKKREGAGEVKLTNIRNESVRHWLRISRWFLYWCVSFFFLLPTLHPTPSFSCFILLFI